VTSSSQRPLPDNTQHSQQTNIHAPCGIRPCNPSNRAAADPRFRPRDHWGRLPLLLGREKNKNNDDDDEDDDDEEEEKEEDSSVQRAREQDYFYSVGQFLYVQMNYFRTSKFCL